MKRMQRISVAVALAVGTVFLGVGGAAADDDDFASSISKLWNDSWLNGHGDKGGYEDVHKHGDKGGHVNDGGYASAATPDIGRRLTGISQVARRPDD
ncbi:hypothetical protein [Streptomyces sp. NPDC051219]|uniref:hypothetical protein n=1 Tax=Streptomyces sp. NPDC051219 TaxID=3155283 RepID=UPI003447BEEF